MKVSKEMILPGRVLQEDEDHIVLEIGKHEGASFNLQSPEGVDAAPQQFYTVMFCKFEDGAMVIWRPWAGDGE